jgi:hypothetical protein
MYACVHETGRGFLAGVCAPNDATAHSCDPPSPHSTKTGAPLPGLRPEEDHAPLYLGWRFSLG